MTGAELAVAGIIPAFVSAGVVERVSQTPDRLAPAKIADFEWPNSHLMGGAAACAAALALRFFEAPHSPLNISTIVESLFYAASIGMTVIAAIESGVRKILS